MKKMKAILAMIMVFALLVMLFAACGSSEQPADENGGGAAPGGTGENDIDYGEEDEDEVANIKFYLIDMYGVDTYEETIENAINAITVPEIGVNVDVGFFGMGDYNNRLSMDIAAGDPVDAACIWVVEPCSVTTMYSQNQLMEISGLLDTHGSELKELVGDYLGAYTINGGIYGVPTYRNFSTSVYLTMRKDVLEQLDMVDYAYNMTTFAELEELLIQVRDNTDLYPLGSTLIQNAAGIYYTGDNFKTDIDSYDLLGDSLYVVHADGQGEVTATFENDSYLYTVQKMVEWKDKDLIWPDILTNDEHVDNIMKQGVIFASIQPCEIGAETAKTASTGYEVACITMGDCMVMTSDVNKFGVGIPITAAEPEAAMKFLNLMYQSEELMNIIDWGIEGDDFVITETGEAAYVDNDSTTARYHNPDFIFGNYFLVAPWIGDGADFREVAKAANDAAPRSPYLGFVLDASDLTNTIAGISAVRDEFEDMTYGYYTQEHYQSYVAKMESAGVRDYLQAVQTQLDAFVAAQ